MEYNSEFLRAETGSRAEEEEKSRRRAVLSLPLLALAACSDNDNDNDDNDSGPAPVQASPSLVPPLLPGSVFFPSSSVEPDDVSRDRTDEKVFTLTFSDDLLASSVQATDFTITDSNGRPMRVLTARVVRGMADEVALTGTHAWEGVHTLSFSEGDIRDDVGVSLEDWRVTLTFSDGPISSVVPDDISRDRTDATLFTLTFTDDLQASSVEAADFTITDSNGRDVRVLIARVVRGMADEVELTGTRPWEGTHTLSFSEGAIRDDVGVSLGDWRVTFTLSDAPAPTSSVEPDAVSRDRTDATLFTLTFSDDLLASSVQATDFTITDSNGRDVGISAAMVVRGMADEVELTGTHAWEGVHTLSFSEGDIRDDAGVSLEDWRVTLTFADAPTPAPRPGFNNNSHNFTLTFPHPVEVSLGLGEYLVFDEGDLARDLFSFSENALGSFSASIWINDATFYLGGREVPFGRSYGQLLGGTGGFSRGDFNKVEMTLLGSDAPLAATSAICVHSSGLANADGSPVDFAPLC